MRDFLDFCRFIVFVFLFMTGCGIGGMLWIKAMVWFATILGF